MSMMKKVKDVTLVNDLGDYRMPGVLAYDEGMERVVTLAREDHFEKFCGHYNKACKDPDTTFPDEFFVKDDRTFLLVGDDVPPEVELALSPVYVDGDEGVFYRVGCESLNADLGFYVAEGEPERVYVVESVDGTESSTVEFVSEDEEAAMGYWEGLQNRRGTFYRIVEKEG